MGRKKVCCGFSEAEITMIDRLVDKNIYCSRSDAIRSLACDTLQRKKFDD